MKKRKLATLIAPLTFGFLLTTPALAGKDDPLPPDQVHTLRRSPSLFKFKPNSLASQTGLSGEQYWDQFGYGFKPNAFSRGMLAANEFIQKATKQFGTKTNPNDPQSKTVDISFPNLERITVQNLADYQAETTDFKQKLTLGQLRFMLTDHRSPFYLAILDCLHSNYQEDQANSKLTEEDVTCFVDLLTCHGSAIDLSELSPDAKNQVIDDLKKITGSKTGFQGLFSLLIATTLNSDSKLCFNKNLTSIKIKYNPFGNCGYLKSNIFLDRLHLDNDQALFHELAHARHDALNMDCAEIALPFVYFSAAKNDDLLAKLIPANPKQPVTPPTIDYTNFIKKFLIENGLWEYCSKLPAEETYSFFCQLIKIRLGANDRFDLWHNSDEITTMLGVCPLFVGNQLYIIEDRQNQAQYVQRNLNPDNTKESTLESIYCCHNCIPCPKNIEHLFDEQTPNFDHYRTIDVKYNDYFIFDDQTKTLTISKDLEKLPSFAELNQVNPNLAQKISQTEKIKFEQDDQGHTKITEFPADNFITELTKLTELTIPKDLTKISADPLSSSRQLKIILAAGLSPDLELPAKLKIGRDYNGKNLLIECPKSLDPLKKRIITAFNLTVAPQNLAIKSLKRGITLSEDQSTLIIDCNVTEISSADFEAFAQFPELMSQIKTITIQPNSQLTAIPSGCFKAFHNLKKLDLGTNSQIKEIGDECCAYDTTIDELTIPTSVEKIGLCAFRFSRSVAPKITFENNQSHLQKLDFDSFDNFKFTKEQLPQGISPWNQDVLLKDYSKYFAFNKKTKTVMISCDAEQLPSLNDIRKTDGELSYLITQAEHVEFERDSKGNTKITEISENGFINELKGLSELTIPKSITKISAEIIGYSDQLKIILEDGLSPQLELPRKLRFLNDHDTLLIECSPELASLKERFVSAFNWEDESDDSDEGESSDQITAEPVPTITTTKKINEKTNEKTDEKTKKYPIALNEDGNELIISAELTELNEEDLTLIPDELRKKIMKITFADHCPITKIPKGCFAKFDNLQDVNFGRQMCLKSIEDNAFFSINQKIININNLPTSLENIGFNAFSLDPEAKITFENNSSQLKNISASSLIAMPTKEDIYNRRSNVVIAHSENEKQKTFALRRNQLPDGLSYGVEACLTQDYQGLLSKKGATLTIDPRVTALPADLASYQKVLGTDFNFDQITKIVLAEKSNLRSCPELALFKNLSEMGTI